MSVPFHERMFALPDGGILDWLGYLIALPFMIVAHGLCCVIDWVSGQ